MIMDKNKNEFTIKNVKEIEESVRHLNLFYISLGLTKKDLKTVCCSKSNYNGIVIYTILFLLLCVLIQSTFITTVLNYFFGVRCILRNNYIVWEATRPLSNCEFCHDIVAPIVLKNITKDEFSLYAYTSKPVVIKEASLNWPARQLFDLNFFKNLYLSINDSYRSVDDECQFLHFKSNFISIKDVFNMTQSRIKNAQGETSWYVGW